MKSYTPSQRVRDQINLVHSSHNMTDEQRSRAESARDIFLRAACDIAATIPDGRELSIVLIKLEEASFFAVAAIARETETA